MRRSLAGRLAIAAATVTAIAVVVPAATADAPPRVSGLSVVLDVVSTGSTVGASEVYTLGESVINVVLSSASLPAAVRPYTNKIYVLEGVPQTLFGELAGPSAAGINELRQMIAPLAAYNTQTNAGINAAAGALVFAAQRAHPVIEPLDVTVINVATFLQNTEVH